MLYSLRYFRFQFNSFTQYATSTKWTYFSSDQQSDQSKKYSNMNFSKQTKKILLCINTGFKMIHNTLYLNLAPVNFLKCIFKIHIKKEKGTSLPKVAELHKHKIKHKSPTDHLPVCAHLTRNAAKNSNHSYKYYSMSFSFLSTILLIYNF
jgi:hypothetical protein